MFLFASCAAGASGGSDADGGEAASLSIQLPSTVTGRSAVYEMVDSNFEIFTVSISSSEYKSEKSCGRGQTVTFSSIPIGFYEITVIAKKADGTVTAKGTATANVQPDAATSVYVPLEVLYHHTVTFINQDGSTLSTQEITDGYTATKPADPVSSIGKTFSFWTADATVSESSSPFSFSTPITADITLKPVFVGEGLVTMKTGYAISTALKALGANVSPNKTFSASATPPDAGTETQLLSDASSLVEVKAWCEGTSIKYYAEGFTDSNVKIPLNANSSSMFSYCANLTSIDMSGFDTSNVTTMEDMFSSCSALTSLDLSGFDTSSVTTMDFMFSECEALTSLDLSSFNTSSVTDMQCMFSSCKALTSLDLSGFDTSSVTTMDFMFSECEALTSLDLSSFNTSSVTNMNGMFRSCSALTSLDLSSFNTSSVTKMKFMFNLCRHLTTIYVSSSFVTTNVTDSTDMFNMCLTLQGGAGTTYISTNPTDKTYARIDGTGGQPGYFTQKP